MARKDARPADRKCKAELEAAMAAPKQARKASYKMPTTDGSLAMGLAMGTTE